MLIPAPTEVQAPTATIKGGTYIVLSWVEPRYPNGIITGYYLYKESSEIYSGGEQTFNATGLLVRN